jgi:hypothetical protein
MLLLDYSIDVDINEAENHDTALLFHFKDNLKCIKTIERT